MDSRSAPIESNFQLRSISGADTKSPLRVDSIFLDIVESAEEVRLAFVPEHGAAKDKTQRQVVAQRFERAWRCGRPVKIRMRPSPEATMPVAAIVALQAKSQWLPFEPRAVESDVSGKRCVGMGRARKPNPALAAQRDPKRGGVAEVPFDLVSIDPQPTTAGILIDGVVRDGKLKGRSTLGTELKSAERETLDEAFRFCVSRKPCCPDLDRHTQGVASATVSARIQQQIAEPPGAAAVGKAKAEEPNLVSAPNRERRVGMVECVQFCRRQRMQDSKEFCGADENEALPAA